MNFLEDKLEDLIMQIDQQIEERRIVDRKLRQLPRGEMMTWDGNVESYVDFIREGFPKKIIIFMEFSIGRGAGGTPHLSK